ncbi:unnamed protein product [Rotaria socialis]|uniref:Uncharacterized protein n=1 Tax=Rotaria socialis TaxID=392032 RepID=A0A818CFM9_9BILA|nr:unnamed protein product [Rotaria socialis]
MTSRSLMIGFDYDLTRSSLIWCRTRQFITGTYPPLALTFGSLTTFDQFVITSRSVCLHSNTGNFYVFLVASSPFRRIVRERLFSCRKNPNEIRPTAICSNKSP